MICILFFLLIRVRLEWGVGSFVYVFSSFGMEFCVFFVVWRAGVRILEIRLFFFVVIGS